MTVQGRLISNLQKLYLFCISTNTRAKHRCLYRMLLIQNGQSYTHIVSFTNSDIYNQSSMFISPDVKKKII